MKYAMFGGSFDPIHLGHLILAETCRVWCGLDRVVFVPTGVSPHRHAKPSYRASASHRVAMVEMAITSCDGFIVSRYETDRTEVSFTADTISHFHEIFPGIELYLIVGSEMLADLPNWHAPATICRLATPLTVHRFGREPPHFESLSSWTTAERIERFRHHVVPMPAIDISSTMIRQRIAEDKSIRFLTPRVVESYITHHRLYTPETRYVITDVDTKKKLAGEH